MKKAIPWVAGLIALWFVKYGCQPQPTISMRDKLERETNFRNEMKDVSSMMKAEMDFTDTSTCFINSSYIGSRDNINFCYPCRWVYRADTVDGDKRMIYYNNISDTCMVALSISIETYSTPLTAKRLKTVQTDEYARFMVEGDDGTFISRKSLSVCGLPTEEINFKTKRRNGVMAYSQVNHIYAPKGLINLSYSIVNSYEDTIIAMMKRYHPLFERLRGRTKF